MSDTPDTISCGAVITLKGRRHVVAEVVCYPTNGGTSLHATVVPYENCEPMVDALISQGCKPKKKAKRKVKSR
jgi:hypothetical protein